MPLTPHRYYPIVQRLHLISTRPRQWFRHEYGPRKKTALGMLGGRGDSDSSEGSCETDKSTRNRPSGLRVGITSGCHGILGDWGWVLPTFRDSWINIACPGPLRSGFRRILCPRCSLEDQQSLISFWTCWLRLAGPGATVLQGFLFSIYLKLLGEQLDIIRSHQYVD